MKYILLYIYLVVLVFSSLWCWASQSNTSKFVLCSLAVVGLVLWICDTMKELESNCSGTNTPHNTGKE